MHLLVTCSQCFRESLETQLKGVVPPEQVPEGPLPAELSTDGWCEVECPRGHRFVALLKAQIHELLFKLGLIALIDGYTRESVANFQAALERCYEFSIRFFLAVDGVTEKSFEATWKPLSNSSERQLGAYMLLYLSKFKQLPPTISEKQVAFRNSVIHKGEIPTKQATLVYAEEVYGIITSLVQRMLSHNRDVYVSLEVRQIAKAQASAEKHRAVKEQEEQERSKKEQAERRRTERKDAQHARTPVEPIASEQPPLASAHPAEPAPAPPSPSPVEKSPLVSAHPEEPAPPPPLSPVSEKKLVSAPMAVPATSRATFEIFTISLPLTLSRVELEGQVISFGCSSFGTTRRKVHGTTRSIGLRRKGEGSTACGMVPLA